MFRERAWSIPLGSVGRSSIRLHLSFLLLAAVVAFEASASEDTFLAEASFSIALFIAVLLHELFHGIAALRFGVGTKNVLLYPFGGVAQLTKEIGPRIELGITCAGPLGNALCAFLLVPFSEQITDPAQFGAASFATKLFAANVALILFNLIPAFPLDGGRALKCSLELLSVKNSTELVARISQGTGVFIGILGLLSLNVFLLVIAAVIFSHAFREMVRVQALTAGRTVRVKDAMIPLSQLLVFPHGTSLPDAVNKAVRSFHHIFPVTYAGGLLGFVTREALLRAATHGEENDYIGSITHKDYLSVSRNALVSEVSERMQASGDEIAFVVDDSQLEGLLIREKLIEFLLLQGVRQYAHEEQAADKDGPFL